MSITITNTLATITNGTNIYLQQQITTTSNIINTINQTAISSMPIDGWVIFGASISVGDIATVVSAIFMVVTAGIMWCSVLEMRKDSSIKYSQNMMDKIEIIVEKFLRHRYGCEQYTILAKEKTMENIYSFIIQLVTITPEYYSHISELEKIEYIIKLNKNEKQYKYFIKIKEELEKIETTLCEFSLHFAGNMPIFEFISQDQKQKIENLPDIKNILILCINNYHHISTYFNYISIEKYQDIDTLLDLSCNNTILLQNIIKNNSK